MDRRRRRRIDNQGANFGADHLEKGFLFVDLSGPSGVRVNESGVSQLGFGSSSETGIGKLGKRGVVEVVNLDDDFRSAIDLKLSEKWGLWLSLESDFASEKMEPGLSLVSDFASEKMLWERVIARVRFETMHKTRLGGDNVKWKDWFLKRPAVVDDDVEKYPPSVVHVDENGWVNYVAIGQKAAKQVKKAEEFDGAFGVAYKSTKARAHNEKMKKEIGLVKWIPAEKRVQRGYVPPLAELSFAFLAEYAEGIVSLENVPVEIRQKLSRAACDYGKMNCRFMKLLVAGAPSEICVQDCSWMKTEEFIEIFRACDTHNMKVLCLDLCGRCELDRALSSESFSPGAFDALQTLSLKGASHLTDSGLGYLVQLAPSIRSLNLSQCSLLTAWGINTLAEWYKKTLEELYLDDCLAIDGMTLLPALTEFSNLRVLSTAGSLSVCDDFVCQFVAIRGSTMKELVFASCKKLTNKSMEAIGSSCSALVSLDISNVPNLTDFALQHIANGCKLMKHLELSHEDFSDEAVAALLKVCGHSLTELSLKDISKVGPATAFSLTKFTRQLTSLDLSWCLHITDDMLGEIVDCCTSLRLLQLFGCSQITNRFLNGHSNHNMEILGASPTPELKKQLCD